MQLINTRGKFKSNSNKSCKVWPEFWFLHLTVLFQQPSRKNTGFSRWNVRQSVFSLSLLKHWPRICICLNYAPVAYISFLFLQEIMKKLVAKYYEWQKRNQKYFTSVSLDSIVCNENQLISLDYAAKNDRYFPWMNETLSGKHLITFNWL